MAKREAGRNSRNSWLAASTTSSSATPCHAMPLLLLLLLMMMTIPASKCVPTSAIDASCKPNDPPRLELDGWITGSRLTLPACVLLHPVECGLAVCVCSSSLLPSSAISFYYKDWQIFLKQNRRKSTQIQKIIKKKKRKFLQICF